MSDKGYLSKDVEVHIAKMLDGLVDFDAMLGKKTILFGMVNIGRFLERKDRKIFESLIEILDEKVIGENPNEEVKKIIDKVIELLSERNFKEFNELVADLLVAKIETPFGAFEKQIFMSVLLMFNGIIGKAIDKAEQLINEANNEA